ncbi:DUF397 domain-containing protein [Actinoplanes sp. NBC_00393]|uniref:DUF397 domain-containing protein n=1 Tax=Actinoplanes sp. NBC_00393 TaxID=2975953 RepID=UPI002E21B430
MTRAAYTNWRKATASDAGDNCVEVAVSTDGATVGMRDSKNPQGAILQFDQGGWRAFLAAVRSGEFDPRLP